MEIDYEAAARNLWFMVASLEESALLADLEEEEAAHWRAVARITVNAALDIDEEE